MFGKNKEVAKDGVEALKMVKTTYIIDGIEYEDITRSEAAMTELCPAFAEQLRMIAKLKDKK